MKKFLRVVIKLIQLFRYKYKSLSGSLELDRRISVGPHTYGITEHTNLFFRDDDCVEIGDFCSFARGVTIVASGEHNYRAVSSFPFHARFFDDGDRDTYSKGRVSIGNDVWVGANAIILSGVTVGDGAVIAAGAVVVDDVPPYAIAAGVPAKVIKYRFSQEIIERLLSIRWWNWPPDVVRANIDLFYLDVATFIDTAASRNPEKK